MVVQYGGRQYRREASACQTLPELVGDTSSRPDETTDELIEGEADLRLKES